MLLEEGVFQLNDPLYKYAPEFKEMQVHTTGNETEAANLATYKWLWLWLG